MKHTPGVAARLLTAVADAGINVRTIDQGASELSITIGVDETDLTSALRAIYEAFVQ
jgi:aspartate kinase